MTGPINPIVSKIEKLLRLSKDQDGTPEGETAAKLASRMMTAHAIEMAQIDLDKQADHDPIESQGMKVKGSVWRRSLASSLAQHCSCSTSYRSNHHSGQKVWIYGHRTDIAVCRYLYEICERQIENAAKVYLKGLSALNYWPGEKKKMGNDFRRSAILGLHAKLGEIRREAKEEDTEGFALVITRKQRVDDWVKENYSFGKGCSASFSHNSAGYKAGSKVNLNAGVGSSGNPTARIGGRRLLGGE